MQKNKRIFFLKQLFSPSSSIESCFYKTYGFHKTNTIFLRSFLGLPLSFKLANCPKKKNYQIDKFFKNYDNFFFGQLAMKNANMHMGEIRKIGPNSYRRRSMALPVRGQRTHSNAQTFRRYYNKFSHWRSEKIINKNKKFSFSKKPRKVLSKMPKPKRRSFRKLKI